LLEFAEWVDQLICLAVCRLGWKVAKSFDSDIKLRMFISLFIPYQFTHSRFC